MRIRVAILVGETFNGGVGSCMLNYFRHVNCRRVAVTFFVASCPSPSLDAEIRERGGRVVILPPRKHLFAYVLSLLKCFHNDEYDVVHANLTTLNVIPLFAAWCMRVPVRISHSHSTSSRLDVIQNLIKNVLRLASHWFVTDYLACSEMSGRWLFGDKLYDEGRVTVLRNAIDINKFSYDKNAGLKVRRKFNLVNKFVVGHIGRFATQKNHQYLISIFEAMLAHDENARLLLVGEGELEDRIRSRLIKDGILDKVVFAGSQSNITDYYSAMDVFVFPSLFEGLSMVLVEAQANGLPCVVSTNNSIESKLTELVSFISLERSAEEWVETCIRGRIAFDDANSRKSMIKAGYDICDAAVALENIYLNALNRRK